MASRAKCPVAELERQILAAMHIEDAAARAGNAIEAAAARTLARELLDQQLDVIAGSEHGVILQMIQRYRAIDVGDTAIVERLERHIREAVDIIERALGACLTESR